MYPLSHVPFVATKVAKVKSQKHLHCFCFLPDYWQAVSSAVVLFHIAHVIAHVWYPLHVV